MAHLDSFSLLGLAHSRCSGWLPNSPQAALLTREKPRLPVSQLHFLHPRGSSEAWQPWRSPPALSACPGGFPRKLAFRLGSAEPGLQLPAPLLAIGKFPVPLRARCVRGRELAARGPGWSCPPSPARVSTSSVSQSRRMKVLGPASPARWSC